MEEDNVWVAAGDGDLNRTLQFLGTGPVDVTDENGFTPLMAASQYGRLSVVQELLNRGADPNFKDSEGNTAVHHCDYADCLAALVDKGGLVSIFNTEGQTPLDMKREDLQDAENEFSDDEDQMDERGDSTAKRLSDLVSLLLQCAAQEETRKRTRQ